MRGVALISVLLLGNLTCLFPLHAADPSDSDVATPENVEFFEKRVRPLLVERCHKCHGTADVKGGLQLISRQSVLKGGDSGSVVVPGNPDESELIKAVRYDGDSFQMPPTGKLPDEEIAILFEWVKRGAPFPGEVASQIPPVDKNEFKKRADHWSFRPLSNTVPAKIRTENLDWPRNPIDRFILASLEKNQLLPASEADRSVWLRRVFLDTIGLPPSPEQRQSFLDDPSPDAHEKIIEQLLDSPHFGERWGRHWLDLVRYAESRGHEFDFDIPNPWHYRDYVVRAINEDVSYDRFLAEHLAGDVLKNPRLHPITGADESILGTGFWFLGEWVHSPVDIRRDQADRFDNMIDVMSKTFLGLTVACARCHDHKFDPITQTDYYSLYSFLLSSSYRQVPFESLPRNRRLAEEFNTLHRSAYEQILTEMAESARPTVNQLDKILIAAGEAIRRCPPLKPGETLPNSFQAEIAALAQAKQLDPNLLQNWVVYLLSVPGQSDDPFHSWMMSILAPNSAATTEGANQNVLDVATRAFGDLAKDLRSRQIFLQGEAGDPLLSVGNGRGPTVVFSDSPEMPIAEIIHTPASEGSFKRLTNAPLPRPRSDVMFDPGPFQKWQRGTNVVRTRNFKISAGKIFCRIRGTVNTYIAVDSHALIVGPLHGSLVREHPAPPESKEWRWIEHDVSPYRGHDAHVEFIVPENADFELSEVFQFDAANEFFSGKESLLKVNSAGVASASPDDADLGQRIARSFQSKLPVKGRPFPRVAQGDERDAIGIGDDGMGVLRFIVKRPQLFGLDTPDARAKIRSVSEPLLAREKQLLSEFATTSSLAPAMWEGVPAATQVFARGNPDKPGEVAPMRYLQLFQNAPVDYGQSNRARLADEIVGTSPQLVSRVIVNRIWQHYFGTGIVPTSDDFGHMGQPPTHPELLDWLAGELISHDWSTKQIHRLILSSATYRMSSQSRLPRATEVDPGNRLLHRGPIKRLEGEVVRDVIFALSHRLDDRMEGRSIPVYITPFMDGRGKPESGPLDGNGRRSIYISVRRNFPDPFFQAFDFPNPHSTHGVRNVSNVPAQALALLNNPMIGEQTRLWAARILNAPNLSTTERINRLYLEAFSRLPSQSELTAATNFIESSQQGEPLDRWSNLCHSLVNLKELIIVR